MPPADYCLKLEREDILEALSYAAWRAEEIAESADAGQ
jgi:uncharacterized protein (DUF433 family)